MLGRHIFTKNLFWAPKAPRTVVVDYYHAHPNPAAISTGPSIECCPEVRNALILNIWVDQHTLTCCDLRRLTARKILPTTANWILFTQ